MKRPTGPKQVVADIGRARADVAARVAEVNEMTAREVYEAAAAMADTVDQAANCLRRLGEIAKALESTAPTITQHYLTLQGFVKHARGVEGRDDAIGALTALGNDLLQVSNIMTQVIGGKDEALGEVVARSRAALSHLQFQDVAAQGLQRLDERLRALQTTAAIALGVSCEIAIPVHEELGGDKPVTLDGAGEVKLF